MTGEPWLDLGIWILGGFVAGVAAQEVLRWTLGRLARRTTSVVDDQMARVVRRAAFRAAVLTGLLLANRSWPAEEHPRLAVERILLTLGLLVLTGLAGRFVHLLLEALSRAPDRFQIVEPRTRPVFEIVAKVVLVGGAVYLVLLIWELDPSAWLASAGIIGIAVGFAAQDTLGNLFSGVFIIADAPYRVGDYIVLDNGTRGEVKQIGLRSTRVQTRDDVEITIPNSVMAGAMITNQTGGRHSKMRIRVAIGVAYGSDIDQVQDILRDLAQGNELVCEDPEPRVRFRAFGSSSLDFELCVWVRDPALRGLATHQLNCAIYKRFAEAGVEIPFPQRDVHVKHLPSRD